VINQYSFYIATPEDALIGYSEGVFFIKWFNVTQPNSLSTYAFDENGDFNLSSPESVVPYSNFDWPIYEEANATVGIFLFKMF
jgi:hypothetical protein